MQVDAQNFPILRDSQAKLPSNGLADHAGFSNDTYSQQWLQYITMGASFHKIR